MNLASRCREAIAQAAALKKELSIQKKKTAEAVHQTHQLISQVKKMSPERQSQRSTPSIVTPNVVTPIECDGSEHKEDDVVQIVHRHETVDIPSAGIVPEKSVTTITTDDTTLDVSPIPSPKAAAEPSNLNDTTHPKPDAPTSSEEDLEEETDTVPETIKPAFPASLSRSKSQNDSYDEEYPEEPAIGVVAKKGSSLLSSIDAFEASFSTNFPESFTPKDEDAIKTASLYNPFDTTSPTKGGPPANLTPTSPASSPTTNHAIPPGPLQLKAAPNAGVVVSTKQQVPLNLKAMNSTTLSPKNGIGLDVSPRDTPPRKLSRQQEEKASLLVKALPLSLNMVELKNHDETSPDSPDIEVLSPNGQTRLTPVMSPASSTSSKSSAKVSSYEMVPRGADGPEDETFPSRMRSRRVGPTPEHRPVARFKKPLAVETTRQSRGGPLSSRSNGGSSLEVPVKSTTDTSSRVQRASRPFGHVGSAAAKVRELKARDRSSSAPRIRTLPSLTFSENPERPQQLTGYGSARARYERAIHSPKDVSDIPMDGRQRRNVNLSNRRRADFGSGASPLNSSPKSLTTK